jgi:hypothetical protein
VKTLAQTHLARMLNVAESQDYIRLSNKTVLHEGNAVSFRMWGDVGPTLIDMLATACGAKLVQQLRKYERPLGIGERCMFDMRYARNLGMGEEVEIYIEVLRTGSMLVTFTAKSTGYKFTKF